ncbi:MAG: glutathione S-transferase N-terminal domain-containing protein [Alphaproteobacteria bacterium]|nr:glutathione S-transferase N-terminal domain-containing protein [Alphaproteobacteria bacterium]
MKLYSHPVSPFARKARIIAHELGLKLDVITVQARNDESLRRYNPLKQIPILVLDDGSSLFDSPVICEYLNHTGGGKFFPGMNIFKNTSGRWKALGLQALGDGVADAAVAWRYELIEPEERRNPDRIARCLATITAGLDALERVNFPKDPTIGEISVACALGYIDFRLPDLDWKSSRPKLAGWYAQFSEYKSMKATAPAAP